MPIRTFLEFQQSFKDEVNEVQMHKILNKAKVDT